MSSPNLPAGAGLTLYSSISAVLIACMGAFGLISLALVRRTKEIGIRKVMGASESSIFSLMAKDFMILIGSAALAAWPVTYLFLRNWLQDFAYRAELNIFPFLWGILMTASVIMGTIMFKIARTVRTDPVDALRCE